MGALCIDDRCLSVRLSVPDPKSRMERRRKLEIGREEASDTRYPWPHLEVRSPKFKVTGLLNAVTDWAVESSPL